MEDELPKMALDVIEWDAMHDEFSRVYRFAHTANSPDCRKNHPEWEAELRAAYKELTEKYS